MDDDMPYPGGVNDMLPPPEAPRPPAARAAAHLRTWGLLWAAAVIAVLLVGSTAWVTRGIVLHRDDLAGVHGAFLLSHRSTAGTLEEQLQQLRPFGGWSLSRFTGEGTLLATAGEPTAPLARAPEGPTPTIQGRYRVEQPLEDGALVVEYVPMLSVDLERRAMNGLVLSLFAAVLLVLSVALWIRHRLRLESLTLEAEQTRHLAQLGTLSAVIAHELRNPLTVLLGHVQLLREDLPESRSLRHVEAGAGRLDALLDSLLRFAQTGEVARERVDPVAVLQRAAEAAGVDPAAVTGAAPAWRLDPLRMQQVLLNLLVNAVAASPGGDIEASVGVDGGRLIYEVRDRGGGIPEGMHEQIFEPFHTTRAQGVGLGLAVARAIVEKHGGTLTAHDAPGGGALFRASIPA